MKTRVAGKSYTHNLNRRGFTIIEVLIVLAISALILMAVFLAAPALRQSQTNHARRQYAGELDAQLGEFKSATGLYPSCDSAIPGNCSSANAQANAKLFLQSYLPTGFDSGDPTSSATIHENAGYSYPDTNNIYLYYDAHLVNHSLVPSSGVVFIEFGHWCNTGNQDGSGNPIQGDDLDPSRFAILMGLTRGYYCIDYLDRN